MTTRARKSQGTVSANDQPLPLHDGDAATATISLDELKGREHARELLALYRQTGDIDLRNKVVEANMALAAHVARRFRTRGLGDDELMSEASAALLRAAEGFDSERGVAFAAYAVSIIEHTLRGALSRNRGVIALPAAVRRDQAKRLRETNLFYAHHGRLPLPSEIENTSLQGPMPMSFTGSGMASGGDSDSVYDPLAQMSRSEETVSDGMVESDLIGQLREALHSLPRHLAGAVTLRFGLEDGVTRSSAEVAHMLHVSSRNVDLMVNQAIRQLRSRLASSERETGPGRGGAMAAA